MRKLKIIISLFLILIPLALGIIVFLYIFQILDLKEDMLIRYRFFLGEKGSNMMPIFYGIMLLSGVILLNNTCKKEKDE